MFVSLVRQMIGGAAGDKTAGAVNSWGTELESVVQTIVARAESVAPGEAEKVEEQLRELVGTWTDAASEGRVDHFAGWFSHVVNALLQDTSDVVDDVEFDYPVDKPPWPTMTSLRDVDATSHLYLVPTRTAKKGKIDV